MFCTFCNMFMYNNLTYNYLVVITDVFFYVKRIFSMNISKTRGIQIQLEPVFYDFAL